MIKKSIFTVILSLFIVFSFCFSFSVFADESTEISPLQKFIVYSISLEENARIEVTDVLETCIATKKGKVITYTVSFVGFNRADNSWGLYFLISEVFINKSQDVIDDKIISTKGTLMLALNLSFNNIPIAIAGGISNTSIIYTAIFSLILSTAFMYIGNLIGRKVKSKITSAIAAIILIVLGILKCV